MKNTINILTFIALIMFSINCTAQHVLDPNADKFAGTWKWGDTTNGLTLIMKKENNVQILGNNDPARLDGITGFHKLSKNGTVIEDNLAYSNTNFENEKYSFIGSTDIHTPNPNELRLWMTHKKKSIELKINFIDSTHIKITEVKNSEGIRVILPGHIAPTWSIDIPNNIILTKQ